MKRHLWLALIWWLVTQLALPTWAETPLAATVAIPNAEDLALVADGRWVIASSMPAAMGEAGGALYGVEVASGAVTQLAPDHEAGDSRSWTGCVAPESAHTLSPHGIAAHELDGRELLFVVNHGQRESVEIYEVEAGDTLALRWLDCLELPEGASGNAVAATTDGRVFVTNMNDLEPVPGENARWMGNVLVWTAEAGWSALSGSRLYAPNGLLVTEDGATLYVTSWAAGEVIRLSGGEQVALKLPFLPDNLRWETNHALLATGLRAEPMAVVACLIGQGRCDTIHTSVARIRTDTFSVDCVRELPLAMGTATLPVGAHWWVGPVRGESIGIVASDAGYCQGE